MMVLRNVNYVILNVLLVRQMLLFVSHALTILEKILLIVLVNKDFTILETQNLVYNANILV